MNFTKEYIDLCKNDKLQGLRKELKVGDWFFDLDAEEFEKKINIMTNDIDDINFGDNFIWLPTGDDLDQFIIEQLDDGSDYTFIYTNFSKEAGHYNAIVYEGGEVREQVTGEENPLIAKLKLLLSLLESEE